MLASFCLLPGDGRRLDGMWARGGSRMLVRSLEHARSAGGGKIGKVGGARAGGRGSCRAGVTLPNALPARREPRPPVPSLPSKLIEPEMETAIIVLRLV